MILKCLEQEWYHAIPSFCVSINICTVNVQGLNNKDKCTKSFKWLHKKSNICLFYTGKSPKTYLSKNIDKQSGWDGDIYLSGQHTNKQGIACLSKSHTGIPVDYLNEIIIGRHASIDIKIHEKQLTLMNVYGPNIDESKCYNK